MVRALCGDERQQQWHLPSRELDGTTMAVSVTGKRIKAFKKRHEDEPDLGGGDSDNGRSETDDESEGEE